MGAALTTLACPESWILHLPGVLWANSITDSYSALVPVSMCCGPARLAHTHLALVHARLCGSLSQAVLLPECLPLVPVLTVEAVAQQGVLEVPLPDPL